MSIYIQGQSHTLRISEGCLRDQGKTLRLRAWAVREAYLEIDRREKNGLPLIDPYYVPPGNVRLPTEQEISDREIII
ncbi:hypothetical protein DPMN_017318 [Dreissena polymorpha]|uniref:NADH dehydrogenase [ubiquinone] 1 beta subcomplex subunit 11, mitochondrial n=1 Tax=Dreissena polymorpha TaxID=45954 RepID=A0A9D4S5B8_DREPO|nr:hypothetical protein DPMN_017318 [Dreissena polymorpha]